MRSVGRASRVTSLYSRELGGAEARSFACLEVPVLLMHGREPGGGGPSAARARRVLCFSARRPQEACQPESLAQGKGQLGSLGSLGQCSPAAAIGRLGARGDGAMPAGFWLYAPNLNGPDGFAVSLLARAANLVAAGCNSFVCRRIPERKCMAACMTCGARCSAEHGHGARRTEELACFAVRTRARGAGLSGRAGGPGGSWWPGASWLGLGLWSVQK